MKMTRAILKMKIFFWNKVTCRVCINIQIISNGFCSCDYFNWKQVGTYNMNLLGSETNLLKFDKNPMWFEYGLEIN